MSANKDNEAPERIWIDPKDQTFWNNSGHVPGLTEFARVDPPTGKPDGVEIIRAERERHLSVEGWTPEHDNHHTNGELAQAAACYSWPSPRPIFVKKAWPWELHEWKPELFGVGAEWREVRDARVRVLAKAGALIAAEIDRLERIK